MTQQEFCDAIEVLRKTGWPDNSEGDDPRVRVFVAASQIILVRYIRAGKIAASEGFSPTRDDVKTFFGGSFTARQRKMLKQIADGIEITPVTSVVSDALH
jgi:hypothetical protein